MNTTPRINWQGHVGPLTNFGPRDEMIANRARSFWQSRQTLAGAVAPVPELTDLRTLARDIRAGWSDAR